jgi:hypothetical protein
VIVFSDWERMLTMVRELARLQRAESERYGGDRGWSHPYRNKKRCPRASSGVPIAW